MKCSSKCLATVGSGRVDDAPRTVHRPSAILCLGDCALQLHCHRDGRQNAVSWGSDVDTTAFSEVRVSVSPSWETLP